MKSPSFKFQCPTCHARIRGPIAAGGKKSACPGCGQRLLIPIPPLKKTVLARLLGDKTMPAMPAMPVQELPPVQEFGGDFADLTRPSKTKEADVDVELVPVRPRRGPLVAAVGIVVALFVVAWFWRGKAGTTPGKGLAGAEMVETRGKWRLPEEKIVADYILANANQPASVEFVRWGPHWPQSNQDDRSYLTVQYRASNSMGAIVMQMQRFVIKNGHVIGVSNN